MKEEEHRPKEKRVTLLTPPGATGSSGGTSGDSSKGEDKQDCNKEKKEALSKVVIRRLPPTLTKEHLYPHMYARAYINFKNQEDVILLRDRFDGYVFLDNNGQEYPAMVEFAPFQKAAKKKTKRRDTRVRTIDDDPEYRKFLESYAMDNEKMTSTPETLLEEIEAKNRELIAKKTTPLLEERRREIERKRQREEERRKWKEEEKRKLKKTRQNIPERDKLKDEPKIKLLKKPEKGDEKESQEIGQRESHQWGKVVHCPSVLIENLKMKNQRDLKMRAAETTGRGNRIMNEIRSRLKRREERHRQKESYEKEKTFKRKEMKKEKETLWDKGKKAESTESIGSSEKTEKKEVDCPAMQLYQPGSGDSAVERKSLSHRARP
uniref:UPF3 domain-containing protein n=1 Tax=Cebus imitator TaxID=2715852 RepID=A0A2K5R7E0_CEBIM